MICPISSNFPRL